MQDRPNIFDEVPVADVVEQNQEYASPPALPTPADVPIEANAPDWQEQLQEVAGEDDREEYRE